MFKQSVQSFSRILITVIFLVTEDLIHDPWKCYGLERRAESSREQTSVWTVRTPYGWTSSIEHSAFTMKSQPAPGHDLRK